MTITRRSCVAALLLPALQAVGSDPTFASNFDGTRLLDQEGHPFAAARLAGKTTLYNFVFTGCSTVCPVQTRVLADVLRRLGPDVRDRVHFVSVSLDPLTDSPAVLKAYARAQDVDLKHWSFVTGRPADIDRVAERLRLFKADAGARRPDDHATSLWLADREGRLRQRYPGNPPDAARLVAELTQLDTLTRDPPTRRASGG